MLKCIKHLCESGAGAIDCRDYRKSSTLGSRSVCWPCCLSKPLLSGVIDEWRPPAIDMTDRIGVFSIHLAYYMSITILYGLGSIGHLIICANFQGRRPTSNRGLLIGD